MMLLCLLPAACGGGGTDAAEAAREPYQSMDGCSMEAEVTCGVGEEDALTFTLRCDYVPDGECTVEALAPETVAGVKALVDGETLQLTYEDECLNAGTLSSEDVSPAVCLPRLMDALRKGWLLEQNQEDWDGVPCLRLCMDQTGDGGGKLLSTVWLRKDDGTPVHGEISVDNEIILQAEFTSFQFGGILSQ
jgi:hypothetical protein